MAPFLIRYPTPESTLETYKKWMLLDMQGSLDFPIEEKVKIGYLKQSEDGKIWHLHIGHDRLEGKTVKLPQPLVLMKKVDKELHVSVVIEEKILFKYRPEHFIHSFDKAGQ